MHKVIDDTALIRGSSEMGKLIREKDWSKTDIGEISSWSGTLLTTVNILLNSKFPMFLWWGNNLIQFYNDAYRPSLGVSGKHPDALGQYAIDCWPEIWHIVEPLIKTVTTTGEAVFSEDQLVPIYRNGKIEDVYWTYSYSPVYNNDGIIEGVFVTCMETTGKVLSNKTILETQKALELSKLETENQRDRLTRFFMEAPAGICILGGPDLVFELINPNYQMLLPGRDLLGKPIFTALPELADQPIATIIKDVYEKDQTFEGRELKVPLAGPTGELENRYFNFIYQPRHNEKKQVDGIMVFVHEVTGFVEVKHSLQESEHKFRSIVEQSSIPIMVTRGEEAVIEEVNQPMLDLIRHNASIKGRSVYSVMPELKGQSIIDHLYSCYTTGEKWTGDEQPILMVKDGKEELGYYNVTYQPFIEHGKIAGVLHTAINVTEQVIARKTLEKTEDTLKLSILAANLGTFDLDLENGIMKWDKRCRTLFGISHDNDVSYDRDFVGGLHEDDRERITYIINNEVFNREISNGNYDVEYRTVGADDGKVRWVRAMGKAYFNAQDVPVRFIGSVLDITEQKEDDLRKNDFIGMVSHELKTPLTSLKAYLQILQSANYTNLAPAILPKVEVQVNKMNDLIHGFLNLSRFEAGKLTIDKQPFDLDVLVDEVIESKRLIAPNHVITFDRCRNITIIADKEKIESVVRNLLSNAIKYSPFNTNIHVVCHLKEKVVEVTVTDQGIGIKTEDQQNIFQRYYRVMNDATRTISGFGIGLYLSAEIIKRHGGTIGVQSTPGKGSTFYFTLPVE
ncbi:PAS domain-containing protein [Panacibacter sp. DH6]|uniref:histidine kinase n=1 Tax=Panacibacter microcysteis TaxID=2793269 RepID=A0A931E2Q2_9BACT|nr:PAS domain-containing sensor histidine kinase [Panacibacter microcysteis]MBG9377497.1 PAS domain-containing protein [Panacibacter microcysteis]